MGKEEMYCLSVIIQMLNPNNTLSFNRLLAHGIGLVEAIVYAILIAKQTYYNANGMLYEGGWFYSTIADMQESTTLGEKAQHTAISHLVGHGLIQCEKKGMPAKRFFRIVNKPAKINEILENGQRICDSFKKKKETTMPLVGFSAPAPAAVNGGAMPKASNETPSVSYSEDVENVLKNKQEMPANGVDCSNRPKGGTSTLLPQDKSKDNINQRKIYDDRSINQSAHEKIFENNSTEKDVESVESVTKIGSFDEMLAEIGIDSSKITSFEPDSEEFFGEYSEKERFTSCCKLPYTLMRDRQALTEALKYVSAYSYNCGYGDCENKDDSAVFKTVINRLADFMTKEKTVLPKITVSYSAVFDAVNKIIREDTLSGFIYDFWEHWEEVKRTRDIRHRRAYMMTCLWNYLKDYDFEKEAAEERRDRLIWGSG